MRQIDRWIDRIHWKVKDAFLFFLPKKKRFGGNNNNKSKSDKELK